MNNVYVSCSWTKINHRVRSTGVVELGHHGDAEVGPGLVDLAVNVRQAPLPPWLVDPVAASLANLASYPDPAPGPRGAGGPARPDPASVLLTAGAAQAFVLIAQAYRDAALPVVVHPQFTEPEAALLAAGHRVRRVSLAAAVRAGSVAGPGGGGPGLRGQPDQPDLGAAPGVGTGRTGPAGPDPGGRRGVRGHDAGPVRRRRSRRRWPAARIFPA